MTAISIDYSEITNHVSEILRYFSGKRSGNKVEYFRYVACEADKGMLNELLEEACSWVDIRLGTSGCGYEIRPDNITFEFSDDFWPDLKRQRSVSVALRSLLVRRVALHWLQLVGFGDTGTLASDSDYLLSRITALLETAGKKNILLKNRPVPPL